MTDDTPKTSAAALAEFLKRAAELTREPIDFDDAETTDTDTEN